MKNSGICSGTRKLKVWGRKCWWLRYGKRSRRAKGGKSKKGNRK